MYIHMYAITDRIWLTIATFIEHSNIAHHYTGEGEQENRRDNRHPHDLHDNRIG